MGHVTLTTPCLCVSCHHRLRFNTVYLHATFDDFSFSHSRDIIGASTFKVGHVTLTMLLLSVICYLYMGT